MSQVIKPQARGKVVGFYLLATGSSFGPLVLICDAYHDEPDLSSSRSVNCGVPKPGPGWPRLLRNLRVVERYWHWRFQPCTLRGHGYNTPVGFCLSLLDPWSLALVRKTSHSLGARAACNPCFWRVTTDWDLAFALCDSTLA